MALHERREVNTMTSPEVHDHECCTGPGSPGAERGAATASAQRLHVAPEPLEDEQEILSSPRSSAAPATDGAEVAEGLAEPSEELPHPEPGQTTSSGPQWWQQLLGSVQAPDIWRHDRPSLEKVYRYARHSTQVPDSGPARWFSLGYLGLSMTITSAAYGLAWAAERPSRLGVTAVLVTVLAVWLLV